MSQSVMEVWKPSLSPISPNVILQILLTVLYRFILITNWENLFKHQDSLSLGISWPNSHDLYVL